MVNIQALFWLINEIKLKSYL